MARLHPPAKAPGAVEERQLANEAVVGPTAHSSFRYCQSGSRIDQARTMPHLKHVVDERFCYYNRERRHSQIGNQSPSAYLANVLNEPELAPAA